MFSGSSIIWAAVLLLYGFGTLFFCLRFVFNQTRMTVHGLRLTLGGFAVHAVALGVHFYLQGYPFLKTSFETYQLTSAAIIFVFLILSIFYRFVLTGIVLVPVALYFYILSITQIVVYENPAHWLGNPWAMIHLLFIFLSLSIFTVSFTVGAIYLLKENAIRQKHLGGWLDRLPALALLEQIHTRALFTGFGVFTVGIVTGAIWSHSISGNWLEGDVKQVTSVVAWAFFAILLGLRLSRGWIGRRSILLSGFGFAAVLFLFAWVQRFN